ncbi:MAG: TAXI family TRAP transporter solute-binding subunit [Proteobacteria bacterium]|nr:TAXI family TRAP transporter solute-binding subunit [Pseudomonadota bacterium]
MKFCVKSVAVLALLGLAACLAGGPAASAADLPKMITFTSYTVGSLGYTITSGFREAIEKKTTMKVRVEPYGTDVARLLPLKTGESEIGIATGATATCASYGIAEFAEKDWGPQPIRQVWRGMTLYLTLVTSADSGIKTAKDLKGKRVPDVPGWPAGMLSIEGVMAFGNISWNDVTKVPCSGYVDQIKGVIEGKNDVCYAATVTPTLKEMEAGPHGVAYVVLPAADTEGWKRLQAKAPWLTPVVCKSAPGLAPGQSVEMGTYPYSLWSYESASPDVIYAVVKAMDEGFDIYKGMHKAMPAWNLKGAVSNPSPVPYHEGAIRYYKEKGVWTPEMDKWQAEQLKAFEARKAAAK